MSERTEVWKLVALTSRRYVPMGKDGNRYAPELSVVVLDSTPVAWFLATTTAPGTTAPVLSVTVPLSDAVDCARVEGVLAIRRTNSAMRESRVPTSLALTS